MMEKKYLMEKETQDNILPLNGERTVFLNDEIDDPLRDLLNEFSEYEDDELELYDEDSSAIIELESRHTMTSTTIKNPFHKRNNYTKLLEEQMQLLDETTKRMKFLLDEIDLYIPEMKK